ncbi:hypothetical protein BH23ACT11_BH23ACT11_17830 [soil metagenome]
MGCGRYTKFRMERVRFARPDGKLQIGERARLYIRWMPHLGAEAVALYELLHILPEVGQEDIEIEELAELLRSTPEDVTSSLRELSEAGFITERDGRLEVAEHSPISRESEREFERAEIRESSNAKGYSPEQAPRHIEVVEAEPEGVTPDDYFNYMGTLPAPHIVEFLNGYLERDGMSPDVVREALKIASERDVRRLGYVRSILEKWVERGVKSIADVELFEKERKLHLVEHGGGTNVREGVRGGADRQSAARRREGYEWLFGE